jgi:glutamate/tyrosine decarboxylase-like PLP-dependent enzyme
MGEDTRRTSALDLTDGELTVLIDAAQALARREIEATRHGPVFERPPSRERLEPLLEPGAELPEHGIELGPLLRTCEALLAEGRRTAPAFFGYVLSPPSPIGVAGDLLASAANQNVTSWRSAPAATELELLTIRWLGQLVGFSDHAAGLLVGGGSAANLTGLLLALESRGALDSDRRSLIAYASQEAHFSIAKATAVLGVQLRTVAIDADRRLDPHALAGAIVADRAAGLRPFCVVASAGTTSTGAVDRLADLASVAAEHELWLHADGAYGALAAADPDHRHLFAGINRVDSLCLDPHKWLYVPLDCGALLLREAASVSSSPDAGYVRVIAARELERFAFWEHGLELSRRFRALKLWMTIRYYGARRLAQAIAEDIALASYMGSVVRACDDLELLVEPSLSICCFRHVPAGMPPAALDAHNERLLVRLQRDGRVYLSNADLDGRFALRACITNFRTAREDVERTVDLVRQFGAELA